MSFTLESFLFIFIHRTLYVRKLFFRDNRLVGVLMIGSPKGRKKLVEIVKGQQVLDSAEREALLELK